MKKMLFALVALFLVFSLASCNASKPYTGDPIVASSPSDTQPWPTDTFFSSAPVVASSVNTISTNDDKTTYSIRISEISYEDFVKWTVAMKNCGVSPAGSGEFGLDGSPIDGIASFNGETRKYTVLSTWTDSPADECDLFISFIKK